MTKDQQAPKRFLAIVEEIRSIIEEEQIKIGEKLPSERSLSERLEVGRPTIREALRSMELLGLIETRRGEGTFLADFKRHQLVEVLSTFILQRQQSVDDVRKTRRMHERAAINEICRNEAAAKLPVWESLYAQVLHEGAVWREDVMREMLVASENRLSLKIWFLVKQYDQIHYDALSTEEEAEPLAQLLINLGLQNEQQALTHYEKWVDIIERESRE